MGLADEVRAKRAAMKKADATARRWDESGLRDGFIVETPTDAIRDIIREAIPLLQFKGRCYRAIAPDGQERVVNSVRRPKWSILAGKTYENVTNEDVTIIPIYDREGDESPTVSIMIFRDEKIAMFECYGFKQAYESDREKYLQADIVRTSIVDFLAKK